MGPRRSLNSTEDPGYFQEASRVVAPSPGSLGEDPPGDGEGQQAQGAHGRPSSDFRGAGKGPGPPDRFGDG
jgi:hypothetical protein